MMENNAFLQMLCKSFAVKLYRSSQEHSSTMLYSIRSRVARYLVDQITAQSAAEIRMKGRAGAVSRHHLPPSAAGAVRFWRRRAQSSGLTAPSRCWI
jgi:hypothetical protein